MDGALYASDPGRGDAFYGQCADKGRIMKLWAGMPTLAVAQGTDGSDVAGATCGDASHRRRHVSWALWVLASLLVMLTVAAHAQDHPNTLGPPYRLTYYGKNFPSLSSYRNLADAIENSNSKLTADYGANVTVTKTVYQNGHYVDVTVPCHLRVQYYDQTTNSYMARVSYDEDDGGSDCFYDHGYALIALTAQTYDIGKNLGACDCDGGLGNEGGTPPGSTHQGDPINASTGNKYEQEIDDASPTQWLT